ncbi:hypothetical protein ACLB2K_011923 [Fragaria x ananassa]
MHDEVGKKKKARKNLKKGATTQAEEGAYVVAEKGGPAESEEGAHVVYEKGATAQAEEGASVVAEKGAPAKSEEGAHVVSKKGASEQTKEGASVQVEEGATGQVEKGALVVAEKGATTQAVEGSSGQTEEGATSEAEEDIREGLESFDMTLNGWLEGNEKAVVVDDEGETYKEATANTEEILKKFFNKDMDADQGGGHEEFASEKMYDQEDFRLYEEFVEKESKEIPKATSDEELEYWQDLAKVEGGSAGNDVEGLGVEKVATVEGEEGSAENVATPGEEESSAENIEGAREEEGSVGNIEGAEEEEGSAGNIEGAGEEEGTYVGGAAEREGLRTRLVVKRIKARTDRKEKKMEDFEVQIPLKEQRKKHD